MYLKYQDLNYRGLYQLDTQAQIRLEKHQRMIHEALEWQRLSRLAEQEDDEAQIVLKQPRWMAQQVGRLLQAVGSRLTALREHVSHGPDTALKPSHSGSQNGVRR